LGVSVPEAHAFSTQLEMTAQLSYQDTKGYYGLLVQPSYDQMLQSLKKEVRIPQPDRSAKWYATGIYRSFLLEQAKRFHDAQRKDLEYDESGAQLPAAVERGAQSSMAGTDDVWSRHEEFNNNLNAEEARQVADHALAAKQRQQANQMRRKQLGAYGPTAGHWTVDAHDKDLEDRGIPHAAPTPKLAMPAGKWRSAPNEYIADGQPQATEFPTFEQLNMGQDARYKLGRPAPLDVNKNYQQLRENYL
jgi:hypothetical protein